MAQHSQPIPATPATATFEESPDSTITLAALFRAARDPYSDPIPVLHHALSGVRLEVRQTALALLQELPSRRSIPFVRSALHDGDATVRYAAIDLLVHLDDTEAAGAVVALADDPDRDVRGNVAWALGRLGQRSEAITQALCRLLTDTFWAVRYFAAEALSKVGDSSTVPALRAALPDLPAIRLWLWYDLYLWDNIPFPLASCLQLLRRGSNRTKLAALAILPELGNEHTALQIRQALDALTETQITPELQSLVAHNQALLDELLASSALTAGPV